MYERGNFLSLINRNSLNKSIVPLYIQKNSLIKISPNSVISFNMRQMVGFTSVRLNVIEIAHFEKSDILPLAKSYNYSLVFSLIFTLSLSSALCQDTIWLFQWANQELHDPGPMSTHFDEVLADKNFMLIFRHSNPSLKPVIQSKNITANGLITVKKYFETLSLLTKG